MDSEREILENIKNNIKVILTHIKKKFYKLLQRHKNDIKTTHLDSKIIGGTNMDLREQLKAMIDDEETGVDEYTRLANLAMKQEGLTENTKLLIAETFMGIKADEEKHKQLLKFIYSILQEV